MIGGYLRARFQDGLSLKIGLALLLYGCISVRFVPADFQAAENPFQQLYVSNWNRITLIGLYFPLFTVFLFFHQKLFLQEYYRSRFSSFFRLWAGRLIALLWDAVLYLACMQVGFFFYSLLLGRIGDYAARFYSIALGVIGQFASLWLFALLAEILCEYFRSAFAGLGVSFLVIGAELLLSHVWMDFPLFFFQGFLEYYAFKELLPLLGMYALAAVILLILGYGLISGRDSLKREKV